MHRMRPRRPLCLALLALAAWGCAHAPAQQPAQAPAEPSRYAALDAMLDAEMRELAMPGVSAAMMEHGRIVWTGARGWADAEKRVPVTPDTVFNIASLTKPMTAVVLMQLVELGQLSLDTPMQRYDPSFKDARITVGHVLTMTSEADPPGSSYKYNGNPFGMLNTVIKGVSGEELAKAFSTRLIEPLGLTQTSPGSLAKAPFSEGLSAERVAYYEGINARLARPHHMYGGVEPIVSIPPDPEPNAAANVVSTCPTVIPGSLNDGSKRCIGVSSDSCPRSTSCISTTAVIGLVSEAMLNTVSGVTGTRFSASAQPRAPVQTIRPRSIIAADTPGIASSRISASSIASSAA